MAEPIKMPELGESITEGTITRWLKQEGDQVQADEPLFEVSTDKVDTEVPSPIAGVLTWIKVHEDETVAVGTELAEIEPAGAKGSAAGDGQAAAAPAEAEAPAQTPAEAAEAAGAEAEAGGQEPAVAEVAEEPAAAAEAADAGGETVTVRMPELGESITEGTITRWLKQEGDQVQADEPLFEVSTDKVDTEVPSPVAGVLTSIKVHEDETVAVGTELAEIEPAGARSGDGQAAAAEPEAEGEAPAEAEAPAEGEGEAPAEAGAPAEGEAPAEVGAPAEAPAEVGDEEPEAAEASADDGGEAHDGGGETVTVRMPELGESITEGTITRWLKQEGDRVQADEPLFEVSTDKVDTEVPSPVAGVVGSIKVQEDQTVEVGSELVEIATGAGGGARPARQQPRQPQPSEPPR